MHAEPNDRLDFGGMLQGGVIYFALQGGINVPTSFGSSATDSNARIGGISGDNLKPGDQLPLFTVDHPAAPFDYGIPYRPIARQLRAIPGPEYHLCSKQQQRRFWETEWRIASDSNRMGFRLDPADQPLANHEATIDANTDGTRQRASIRSHAVLPGTVQMPPSGQPIVLMADAQTTGGYPRIATIIDADIGNLAQLLGGQCFRLVPCSRQDAVRAEAKVAASHYRFRLALAHRNSRKP